MHTTVFDSRITAPTIKNLTACATFNETRVQTWKWIRRKSDVHKQTEIQQPRYLRENAQPTRREMKSDSSNPALAQPSSLLPPKLHQLIYRQGDSNQDAMAWPAIHEHFRHHAGTILKKKRRPKGKLPEKKMLIKAFDATTNSPGHTRKHKTQQSWNFSYKNKNLVALKSITVNHIRIIKARSR